MKTETIKLACENIGLSYEEHEKDCATLRARGYVLTAKGEWVPAQMARATGVVDVDTVALSRPPKDTETVTDSVLINLGLTREEYDESVATLVSRGYVMNPRTNTWEPRGNASNTEVVSLDREDD